MGANEQGLNTWLAWRFDEDSITDPRFMVLLEAGDEAPDVAIARDLTVFQTSPGTLELDTLYYWQVIVSMPWRSHGHGSRLAFSHRTVVEHAAGHRHGHRARRRVSDGV